MRVCVRVLVCCMRVCQCVCVCVCVGVCVCVCVCVCVGVYLRMYVRVCVFICLCVRVGEVVCACVHACACVGMCVCACVLTRYFIHIQSFPTAQKNRQKSHIRNPATCRPIYRLIGRLLDAHPRKIGERAELLVCDEGEQAKAVHGHRRRKGVGLHF